MQEERSQAVLFGFLARGLNAADSSRGESGGGLSKADYPGRGKQAAGRKQACYMTHYFYPEIHFSHLWNGADNRWSPAGISSISKIQIFCHMPRAHVSS